MGGGAAGPVRAMRRHAWVGTFRAMDDGTHVSGGQGFAIAGTVGPGGPEPTLEWLRPDPSEGLVAALTVRLGSESSAERMLVAVLCAVKQWLDADALDALLRSLPFPIRETVRSCEQHVLAPVPPLAGPEDFVRAVAALVERPPGQAETYVRAVFASAKEALPRDVAGAVAARLPPGVAELWREAA